MLAPGKREALAAPISALEAARVTLMRGSAEALPSIRRMTARILDAAVSGGLDQTAHVAAAVLEARRPDELKWLVGHLIEQLRNTAAGPSMSFSILVVEPASPAAELIMETLRSQHRTVLIAHSVREAEAVLREQDVDLVLLGPELAAADGLDFLARLRSAHSLELVPILVITSSDDAVTQAECFALGADGVVSEKTPAEVLGAMVSAKLKKAAELRAEGRVDRVTGLPNRAAFQEALERIVPFARSHQRPLTLAMIDLDHFKAVNDRYGHAMGDHVLRRCGETINSALRVSDFVARWGGEEFCALLPNTDVDGAVIALNKALRDVSEQRFEVPGHATFAVTFSAGVAPLTASVDPPAALADADRLLYLAKEAGRSRVVSPSDTDLPLKPSIVVVEDDDQVAALLIRLLERDGYTVMRFTDGETALEQLTTLRPSVTILDLGLPRMNGFEVLERMRTTHALSGLPVLMLTGSADEADIVKGFALGVNDYLVKPFHPAELVARLRRLRTR